MCCKVYDLVKIFKREWKFIWKNVSKNRRGGVPRRVYVYTAVTVFYEYYYLLVHTCMVYAGRPTPQKRASPAVLRVSASPRVRVEGINLETLGSGTLPGSTCTLS